MKVASWIPAVLASTVLLALLGLLVVAGRGGSRATSDLGPGGTAAAAGVLERLGYEVSTLRLGLHVLPRSPLGLLVQVAPPGLVAWPPLTDADAARVLDWVEDGGIAIHATDRQDALLDALGVELSADARPPTTAGRPPSPALPVRPGVWTRGGPLTLGGRGGLVSGVSDPLFAVGEVPVVSRHQVGTGTVLLIADPSIVTNRGLPRAGNLDLLVTAAERSGGVVLFDDLHAGGGDGHGVLAYARRAGAGQTVLLGLLALALLLWRLSARTSAVQPASDEPAIGGAADYVRSLAGLYERARLARHALAVSSRQFRRRVEARAGMSWDHESLEAWMTRELGAAAVGEFRAIGEAFTACFRANEPDPVAVLAAARRAARFEREWLSRGTTARPGPGPHPLERPADGSSRVSADPRSAR